MPDNPSLSQTLSESLSKSTGAPAVDSDPDGDSDQRFTEVFNLPGVAELLGGGARSSGLERPLIQLPTFVAGEAFEVLGEFGA